MGDFTSDTAVANLARLISKGQSLQNIEVYQHIWYNTRNMRKIDIKVSKTMEVRCKDGFLIGGTIGATLPKIVITDRATGNQICSMSRSDKTKPIKTTFRV